MLPSEEEVCKACLRYLHRHLKTAKAGPLTQDEEDFYLMALRGCALDTLKRAFRAGIGKWRWFPRPADILDVYRELASGPQPWAEAGQRPSGCEACGGTGWQPVPGRNAVTPCRCPKGQARRPTPRA